MTALVAQEPVFSGLFNIVRGIVFGIPLPMQPMKMRYLSPIGLFPLQISLSQGASVDDETKRPKTHRGNRQSPQRPSRDAKRHLWRLLEQPDGGSEQLYYS
ncbi:hypothetical protein E4U35_003802 [Claviceps purpurea]|nr:hypothetical protein E4U11_006998 [Claviceps purpurea]KAG6183226.1 hypothetical protein E4U10_006828 [Claviceps purpurea]KAG6204007.1 hypothetical protein E4U35_003802 [Claviceps purpurea]KAG6250289.1 hypothetical protein E4U23_001536 [Claviceps purpurea]KAG6263015.1 hypothetical protein E4U49_002633 [Claviceps purpurea]